LSLVEIWLAYPKGRNASLFRFLGTMIYAIIEEDLSRNIRHFYSMKKYKNIRINHSINISILLCKIVKLNWIEYLV